MKKINYNDKKYIERMDKWFRAANYLSVAQIYLRNNPLLKNKLNYTLLDIEEQFLVKILYTHI